MTSRREGLADRKLIVSSCLEEEVSQCQPLQSWPPAHEPVLQVAVTLQKKSSEPKSRCVRVPIESPKSDTDAECRKNRSPSDATLPGETPAWILNWPPRSLTGLSLAVCWSAQCGRQWLFAASALL